MRTNKILVISALFLAMGLWCCMAEENTSNCCENIKRTEPQKQEEKLGGDKDASVTSVEQFLARLGGQTSKLNSYQADINYSFVQDPEFIDAKTFRKGKFFYQKVKEDSQLRVNFETLQQDDDEPEAYIEQFILSKGWLTKVDYQLETVEKQQLQEDGKPFDAFEFVSRSFPMVGFAKIEDLKKDFEISLIPQKAEDPNNLVGLTLKVKAESKYKDDYTKITFWVENRPGKSPFLPVRFVTESVNDDIYDIRLLNTKVNKKIENRVFKVETPKNFSENVKPLQKG